jgi:hypothetical protein
VVVVAGVEESPNNELEELATGEVDVVVFEAGAADELAPNKLLEAGVAPLLLGAAFSAPCPTLPNSGLVDELLLLLLLLLLLALPNKLDVEVEGGEGATGLVEK